jgi:hypothetical protein
VNSSFVVFDAYGTLFYVASVTAPCSGIVSQPHELVLGRLHQLHRGRPTAGRLQRLPSWELSPRSCVSLAESLQGWRARSISNARANGWFQKANENSVTLLRESLGAHSGLTSDTPASTTTSRMDQLEPLHSSTRAPPR